VPVREVQHELQLQLLPCNNGGGVLLSGARLSPAAGDVRAFLDAAVDGSQVSLSHLVSAVMLYSVFFEKTNGSNRSKRDLRAFMRGLWQSGCFCGRLTGLTQPPGTCGDAVQCLL
jgi:hypothetical protein